MGNKPVDGMGIKAIDLLCPLRPGDVVEVGGPAETGLYVLISEITAAVQRGGAAVVWSSSEPHVAHRGELSTIAARYAVSPRIAIGEREDWLDVGIVACERGERPGLHVIFEQDSREVVIGPRLAEAAELTLVVRPWGPVTRGDGLPPLKGANARLWTDPRMAARGVWPALHPVRTVSPHRDDLGNQASELLERALLGEVNPSELAVAERLFAYLLQPFETAAIELPMRGTSIPRSEMLREVAEIMSPR